MEMWDGKNALSLRTIGLIYKCSLVVEKISFLLRLPVGRGGVINSPRSIFLFSFFFSVESWAAAHGRYRWHKIA